MDETREIWNNNAFFWDDCIGDGNAFQDELIEPSTLELLGDIEGKKIIDIACGAGRLGRRMASMGANVLATDFCENFITRAKERTPDNLHNIEYLVLDATDENSLLNLGENRFDFAVCTMGLMDMVDIEPLFRSLPVILKPEGSFVFSIFHPCFQSPDMTMFSECTEYDNQTVQISGIKITKYMKPEYWKGIGVIGQPLRHYYFHRTLSSLFETGFKNGFVVDGLKEPALSYKNTKVNPLNWRAMRDIPPIIIVRMRLE